MWLRKMAGIKVVMTHQLMIDVVREVIKIVKRPSTMKMGTK